MGHHEKLTIWQPVTNLRATSLDVVQFVEVCRHNDYFKITMQDGEGNILDIIYDDPQHVCPLEYVVWDFRYQTELGLIGRSTFELEDASVRPDKHAAYFGKVSNSAYIKEFDSNPLANKELFPNVEHHVYLTGNEIVEVIANYEPRFVVRR